MAQLARVSIFCPDRTGLVAAIAGYLFDVGVNLGDATFAVLGAGADFTAICELPDGLSLEQVAADLKNLPDLTGAQVTVAPFPLAPLHGPTGQASHYVVISGPDRPGLIARLCETFVEFRANIVWMGSERVSGASGDRYVIRFAVSIPREAVQACLATITNTAESLQLACQWRQI